MQIIEIEKALQTGIDLITLKNFEVKGLENADKHTVAKNTFIQETIKYREPEIFSIEVSTRLYLDNTITEYKTLKFNPNKVLYGHNIYNCRATELNAAVKKLKAILAEQGIELDLTDAIIHDLEINRNFNIKYQDYFEVFLLFFTQIEGSKYFGKVVDSKLFNKKFQDQGFFYYGLSKEIKVYDKTEEVKPRYQIPHLTRLEYKFGLDTLNGFFKKLDKKKEFKLLLEDNTLIDYMFEYYCYKDFIKKSNEYLETEVKKTLEAEYLAFKNLNKEAKKRNRKQQRYIYDYLSDFWVFDRSYLIEIVMKHDRKHLKRNRDKILEIFPDCDNLTKLNEIVRELICPTNSN